MNRDTQTEALVLYLKSYGDSHREAVLLTPDTGLIRAVVYGGSRSKLKSLVSPYHSGRIWLYSDEVKKSVKITDFDVTNFRIGLRENVCKTYCAALCAELVTKTCGAGSVSLDETIELFALVCGFLDGLHLSTEEEGKLGLLRFLWRYQILLGVHFNTTECERCGKEFASMQKNNPVYFISSENVCVCEDCAGIHETDFCLCAEGIHYLHLIEIYSAKEVRAIQLHVHTVQELKLLLFFLTKRAAEGNLKTLESSEGIL